MVLFDNILLTKNNGDFDVAATELVCCLKRKRIKNIEDL